MPFLLIAPTRFTGCPPMTPVNNVGVDPKSESLFCCARGTAHEPTRLRLEAFTSTSAGAIVSGPLGQSEVLPVAK